MGFASLKGKNLLEFPADRFTAVLRMRKSVISAVMRELGKRTSPAKAAAARRNGAKGGRPRLHPAWSRDAKGRFA